MTESTSGDARGMNRSVLMDRMWERLDVTRGESETALFYDLMVFGEMLTKLVVLGMVSAIEPTRERHQYRLLHKLARANGIGEWAEVLEDLLTGPASGHLVRDATNDSREIMQGFGPGADAWQRKAVDSLQRTCQIVDDGRTPQRGKVSLKVWFNDFAWLRNRTRGHGAVRPSTCHQLVPHLEASIREIATNLGLFDRGWAHLRQNLSGKYRVSRLAGDLVAFDPLKSNADLNYADGVHISFGEDIRRVELFETDSDLTDIYIANGGFKDRSSRSPEFEMLSYFTDSVRLAPGTSWMEPPQGLPASETQRRPDLDLVGASFTNMPSMVPGYVARPELETELLQLLRDDRHPMITLVGRGGTGKTSLALAAIHELAQSGEYFAILWFSARDIDLLASGAKLVTPDVLTKEEIATSFTDLMAPDLRRQDQVTPIEFFGKSLAGEEFSDEPILFVFDNFETVRAPAELFSLLDSFVRLPNKVLITSRFRDFRGDYPVPVSGMTRSEFDELVEANSVRLGISGLLTADYRGRLFEESDGHPYVTKVLLGEVARSGHAGSIERIMASKDEILNALFERTFNSIPLAAQRVFLTLCNWRSAVPRLALEGALLRPSNERIDVAGALETLEQSSLVEFASTSEAEGDFVRVPLAAYVFGQKKLRVSPMKAAVESDGAILRLFGAAQRSELGKGLGPRVRTMLGAILERQSTGADVTDELAMMDYLARNYPPAWLLLADYHLESGNSADAIASVSNYLGAVPTDRDAWLRLADLYLAANDGRGEVFARVEAARLTDAPLVDVSNAASTLNRHSYHNTAGIGSDERRSMAEELVAALTVREDECDATDFSRRAWLHLSLNEEAGARRSIELGLLRDPTNRHCVKLASRLSVAIDEN